MPAGVSPVPSRAVGTDTVPDTTHTVVASDSAAVAAADTLPRQRVRESEIARPLPRRSPLLPPLGSIWRQQTFLDSTAYTYRVTERVGETDVRVPLELDFDAYQSLRFQAALQRNFRELQQQRSRQLATGSRRGLGLNIVVPGGRQSAFTTIFGRNEVALRVNGNANINAGFDYRRSDQQAVFTGRASQIDPTFKQDLQLGITGTIGDKLRVNVRWDTQNQFDYQNQLSLQYTGYEDEIIQSIEAGNVFLQTPSSLIRGGQSLFGIKSQFQIGALRLTTVASQQEGQSNSLRIEGGSERTTFEIRPTEYDNNRHFFLSYYFRNHWETALGAPPNVRLRGADDRGRPGVNRITDVEVWRLQRNRNPNDPDFREVVAAVDVGEPAAILQQTLSNRFTGVVSPGVDVHQYTLQEIEANIRNISSGPAYLRDQKGLRAPDVSSGQFKLLRPEVEYTFDPILGFLSLSSPLTDDEALAVAYRYTTATGTTVQVGDFVGETGGSTSDRSSALFVKLLRAPQPIVPSEAFLPAAWDLEMRNLYNLRAGSINPNDFDLRVFYRPPGGTESETVPGVGGTSTLLQLLGFDRIGPGGAPGADNTFDFLPRFSIEPARGLLIFPYLEPFGRRILDLAIAAGQEEAARQRLAFLSLYTTKRETAQQNTNFDVYRVRGSFQGSSQSFFDLRAFSGIVQGSVRVTAGGVVLSPNVDYQVDYSGTGSVTITNPAYISAGRTIEITYEQNALLNLQKKTLVGARAELGTDDRARLGSTVMRMTQRSPVDKFRIGDEPVSNTIWGVDGSFRTEPGWLTRSLDALPLIQTRAASSIAVQGEFAQLRPGGAQTQAFRNTRRDLRRRGLDFYPDEINGVSFIDDFESFQTTYSLRQPGMWSLSAPPDSIGGMDFGGARPGLRNDSLRTNWRAALAWYQLNPNMLREIGGQPAGDPASVNSVDVRDVFPGREVVNPQERVLPTLDLYFDPRLRGPYNFTRNLNAFFAQPRNTWGGMITRLPDGYTDFGVKNIEFVELILRPFTADGQDAGADAALFIDLGLISEDVIPDGELNSEDGLSLQSVNAINFTNFARRPDGLANGVLDLDLQNRRTEDLGLDGFVSYDLERYPEELHEQVRFADFIQTTRQAQRINPWVAAEIARSEVDPSADDYHHYLNARFWENPEFFPEAGGATVQQRFLRYFGAGELNSFEGQNQLATDASIRRGNARNPDSEDLNNNANVDLTNAYYQYRIPLSESELRRQGTPGNDDNFVVGEIQSQGQGTGWFLIRIPVTQYTRRVGDVQDFGNIEKMRMWISGVENPVTVRMAKVDIVGSQWRKTDRVAQERERATDSLTTDTRFRVAGVNTEEDAGRYSEPPGTVLPQTIAATGAAPVRTREQSLALEIENLNPGRQRAIFRAYNDRPLNLLKYSNLRMFAHLNATDPGSVPWNEQDRGRLTLFVRLGSNETNDFFEIEQPLTPSQPGSPAEMLWRNDVNALNVELAALNQLKFARDNAAFPRDSVFTNIDRQGNRREGAPDAETFGVPGSRLSIRGNPSLDRISTLIIGVRNPADSTSARPQDVIHRANVWVNELRVSGYDQTNGWAALGNVNLQLADLGTVRASLQTQTDGFGSLASTLGERDQNATLNWSLQTSLNLNRFLPERYGWRIPLALSMGSNTSTPRFSPARGGLQLEAILASIDARETDEFGNPLSREERDLLKQQELEAAQTFSSNRGVSISLNKSNSRSPVLRNTIDALTLSYSTSSNDSRSPSVELNDAWNWNASTSYQLPNKQPKTLRPLWFLEPIPVLGGIGNLRWNYIPSTFSFSANATRSFSSARQRANLLQEPDAVRPDRIVRPFRDVHALRHNRTFTFQYNPFSFLRTSFDTNVAQDLSLVGVDSLYTYLTVEDGQQVAIPLPPNVALDSLAANPNIFMERRIAPTPFGQVVSRVLNNDARFRTDSYGQNFTSTLTPRLPRNYNWIALDNIQYSARYTWQNGAVGQDFGASIRSTVTLAGGFTLRPQELWRKAEFFRTFEQEQRQIEQRATQERQRKQREAEQRRQERTEQRAARRAAREEARRLAEQGAPADSVAAATDSLATPAQLPAPILSAPMPAGLDVPAPVAATPDSVLILPPGGLPTPDSLSVPADTVVAPTRRRFAIRIPTPKLPSPQTLLRRTVLTLGSMADLRISYQNTQSSAYNGVAEGGIGSNTPYSFYDAVRGRGPGLRYRFGLEASIPDEDRILNGGIQVTDNFDNRHRFTGSTSLRPTTTFTINLNWTSEFGTRENATLRLDDLGFIDRVQAETGDGRVSIWGFGANYLELFNAQKSLFESLAAGTSTGDTLRAGRIGLPLTNTTVVRDFREAFSMSFGSLGARGLLPFPLPGWQMNYTGAGNWPLLSRFAQSATLRHAYSADYSTSYRSNIEGQSSAFRFAGRVIAFELPEIEAGAVNINERFAPLVGLDVRWRNQLTTNVQFNRSNTYSLSAANFDVSHRSTEEISVTAAWQRQGLKLPFMRERLNNRVTFNLNVARSVNDDRRYLLRRALEASIVQGLPASEVTRAGDYVSVLTSTSRLTITPSIGYQFSNTVSGTFSLRYEKFDSADNRTPSFVNINGAFNIRVSITSN